LNKYKGKLLIADMDGTLLNSSRELESRRVEAIRSFTLQGGLFTIATGRMETTTRRHFPELKLQIPAIFYNGALIFDMKDNKPLWEDFLPPYAKNILKDVLSKWTQTGCEVLCGGEIFVLRKNRYTEEQRVREGFKPIFQSSVDVKGRWYKILLADDREKLDEINAYLLEQCMKSDRLSINTVFSEKNLLEILNADTSKGRALGVLRKILREKGFDIDKAYAIGDGENDVELIREADVGIAVANACEAAKRVADIIICGNDKNIISECLDYI